VEFRLNGLNGVEDEPDQQPARAPALSLGVDNNSLKLPPRDATTESSELDYIQRLQRERMRDESPPRASLQPQVRTNDDDADHETTIAKTQPQEEHQEQPSDQQEARKQPRPARAAKRQKQKQKRQQQATIDLEREEQPSTQRSTVTTRQQLRRARENRTVDESKSEFDFTDFVRTIDSFDDAH